MTSSHKSSNAADDEANESGVVAVPEKKMYTSWPDIIRHWPKTTFCIVSNEFCERFSYYGMRTVLTFYLLNVLRFSENGSTIFFNGFTVLCYTTPVIGSIVADGYIGKFWTIFSVSILYTIGQCILAFSSLKDYQSSIHPWIDMIGLFTIGLGTGGIKPCVSAFGGDQFELGQERMLSLFFSMFYFSINAGSMISTFISPIFRSQPCLGQDSCYPLAFGIPAVLMLCATIIFMSGSFWYKRPPPKENILGEVARLMIRAARNKFKKGAEPKEHWLCHYLTNHDCDKDKRCIEMTAEKHGKKTCHKAKLIEDTRSLLRLLVMFIPVPMFWALYDQQGSIWLLQGIQMDCRITDSLLFLPDQMQTLNAVLILAFIPLFQIVVYPLASKCFAITPLRKMFVGGMLAALSFLVTGLVQLSVNTTLPQLPNNGHAFISVWNQFDVPCTITVTDGIRSVQLASNKTLYEDKKDASGLVKPFDISWAGKNVVDDTWKHTFTISYSAECPGVKPTTYDITATNKKITFLAIGKNGITSGVAETDKPTDGTGEFSMGILAAYDTSYTGNFAMCRLDASDFDVDHPCNPKSPADFYYWETNYDGGKDDRKENITLAGGTGSVTYYKNKPVKPGNWGLFQLYSTPKSMHQKTEDKYTVKVSTNTFVKISIEAQGGVYIFALTGDQNKPSSHVLQQVQSNSVNILWQVPQIVILTAAEICFSITGYEFAYSQSAPTMKAVVQAIWLLTTAAGDLIIVIVALLNISDNMATMFFIYTGAMFVAMILFALLSIFYYEYNYYTGDEKSEDGEEERKLTVETYGAIAHEEEEVKDVHF